ncbi:endonuclease/exonuclease/phosphatase family protein [uncultured Kriegella sp.]|uniref:endonuclease/exonuclease/phosphatase family protein n=1 Tax=uncultured Kriegella sp. TaxID=1798910 RepID=UPI0030D73928|tara:strand:+ start:20869 stop:21747 length:879 start_codon:yes stop_codon:yes gene_type:complete
MKGLWFFLWGGFLFLNTSFCQNTANEFSVISYNVWNGFESQVARRDTFVQWAIRQDVDVIAFQELNGYTQDSLEKLARKWGHPYAAIAKENGYPVGISSKHPITNIHRLMEGMHHGGLYAEINGINFFVAHFSPLSSSKRLVEAKAVIALLEQKNKLRERTIILGDFNAFSAHDSLFYKSTGLRERMYLKQKENPKLRNLNHSNKIDYQVIDSFLEKGFFDSFSLYHKEFDSSFPTKVFPSVSPDDYVKIDHMLLSKKMKRASVDVVLIKDSVTDTLSDHYPLKTIFKRKKQ